MSAPILLLVMWASFVTMVFVDLRRRSPSLLFTIGLVLAAGLPASVYLFTDDFRHDVVVDAVVYITAFNLLFVALRFLVPGGRVLPDDIGDPSEPLPAREKRLILLVSLIFLVPFVLKLAQADFSLSLLAASRWRDVIGPSALLTLYCAHISFALILCLVVRRRHLLALLALTAVAALVVVDRRRVMGVAAVAPLLLLLIFWSVRGGVKPLRLGLTLAAGGAALVAFFIVQQIRYFGPLAAAAAADPRQVLEAAVTYITTLRGDLSLFDYFLWLMQNGHFVEGYGDLTTVQRMFTFYLPGDLKPPEFTHSIATAIRGGEQGASIHPTIYGLSWGEAEWFGLLYAPFLAIVFRVLDRIVIRFRGTVTWTLLLGPYSVFAVLAARGSMYNAWLLMLVTFVVLIGLIQLSGIPGRRRFARIPAGPVAGDV